MDPPGGEAKDAVDQVASLGYQVTSEIVVLGDADAGRELGWDVAGQPVVDVRENSALLDRAEELHHQLWDNNLSI